MSIAFDSAGGRASASATSVTFAHTCTGTNRVLFVSANSVSSTTTGVTYNGVALSRIGSEVTQGAIVASLWYLINPATGSNNVVVSRSGSGTVQGASSSYTGVRQNSIPDATNSNQTSATSISVATTTVADNCWVVAGGTCGNGGLSNGTATTMRQSGTNDIFICDNNTAQTPAGSVTLAINCNNGNNAMVSASFGPTIAVTVTGVAGALLLTGGTTVIRVMAIIIATAGNLLLSGGSAVFRTATSWIAQVKSAASVWTDDTKH